MQVIIEESELLEFKRYKAFAEDKANVIVITTFNSDLKTQTKYVAHRSELDDAFIQKVKMLQTDITDFTTEKANIEQEIFLLRKENASLKNELKQIKSKWWYNLFSEEPYSEIK